MVVRAIEKNYIYVHTFHGNQLPISSPSLLIVFAKWAGPYQEMFTVNDAKRLRVRSIGKSGFRFSNSKSRFPNRTRNPKTFFTPEKSFLRVEFNEEIQMQILWIFLFVVRLGNPKKDLKLTVLKNSGLARARIISEKSSDFPIERTLITR